MKHALFLVFSTVLVLCFELTVADEYEDIQDTSEMPIFDTCGTLLEDYARATLRTLKPDERHWFYDSYVCNEIEREENKTLEFNKRNNITTIDYDAIKDTTEKTLFGTCGTLLQHYWEDYSLRNLTSEERNFYYDESALKEIKEQEEQALQEQKDRDWLKKMEDRVLNEELDSAIRARTTDIVYDDWNSPVPKTTVLMLSPADNLDCSQASNVSETDISQRTFRKEIKYGDVPDWLADRYDRIHDQFMANKNRQALQEAYLKGLIASTGRLVTEKKVQTRKKRLLTHSFYEKYNTKPYRERRFSLKDQRRRKSDKSIERCKREIKTKKYEPSVKPLLLLQTLLEIQFNDIKCKKKRIRRQVGSSTKRKRRPPVTNQDGIIIKRKVIDYVEREERKEERERLREEKKAEKQRLKNELKFNKSLHRSSRSTRSPKYTRRPKTSPIKVEPTTEDSFEKTSTTPFRRYPYYTWSMTLGTYARFNLAKEITQPNAEQTEVGIDDILEMLNPPTQPPRDRNSIYLTPPKRLRQTTTPYVEHTFPNRFNRTVYYWMHERKFAKWTTPTPNTDPSQFTSLEDSGEVPLEIKFGDYLFDTRRRTITPFTLNLSTITANAKEYESFLAKHQQFRFIHDQHLRLATINHWYLGDNRFQKADINMGNLGLDFYDRRPYSSTRRQDNVIYEDLEFFGNFTKPDFKRKQYTIDRKDPMYYDWFHERLLDPGHVTANWTTQDDWNEGMPLGRHQVYPNGSLKSCETLIKEDYEIRKNFYGKSMNIYDEEFANSTEITKDTEEIYEEKMNQDKRFFPNVNYTIGPKHGERSVYDIYENSEFEEEYRKWKQDLKTDPLNNITLRIEPIDESYVDPQVIIDQAYKFTTKYDVWRKFFTTPAMTPNETCVHFKFTYDPKQLELLP